LSPCPLMPSIELVICGVPILVSADSARLVRLFADYFRYYDPRIHHSVATSAGALNIELCLRRELPPREKLIPALATLVAQTGIARFWRDAALQGERFYFDFGAAVFRVEPELDRAVGLITPQAFELPHVLANTYTLFPLLLLLRSRRVYHLHAAAVLSPRDELWLLCGSQRSGKTTLTTALGLAGWRPISDDSVLIHFDGASPRLGALKKYFHVSNELLERWGGLREITRHHQYLDRTCIDGLGFFGTTSLAFRSFEEIDCIVLPQIVRDQTTGLAPIAKSEALLKLAEQSVFFQIWPDHTQLQWQALTNLAHTASSYRFLSGAEILRNPGDVARYF
ncbi:MAG: hypothetical protein ACREEM_48340, partial [Blastocatellia bacterium]